MSQIQSPGKIEIVAASVRPSGVQQMQEERGGVKKLAHDRNWRGGRLSKQRCQLQPARELASLVSLEPLLQFGLINDHRVGNGRLAGDVPRPPRLLAVCPAIAMTPSRISENTHRTAMAIYSADRLFLGESQRESIATLRGLVSETWGSASPRFAHAPRPVVAQPRRGGAKGKRYGRSRLGPHSRTRILETGS